jgi:hypothetical protein
MCEVIPHQTKVVGFHSPEHFFPITTHSFTVFKILNVIFESR